MSKNVSCASRPGVVYDVTPEEIVVNIISMSACSACHAKGLCSAFEQKEKVIMVPNTGQNVNKGENVNVLTKTSMGLKATFLAYMLPLFIVMIILLSLLGLKAGELIAGTISLGALVVYYFIISLMQDKLKKQFSFYIEKTD